MRWYQIFLVIICCGVYSSLLFSESSCFPSVEYKTERRACKKYRQERSWPNTAGYVCGEIAMDALRLNRYLFTVDTAKIITAFMPFYIVTRTIDEDIQSRFYDFSSHKNVNQFHPACHEVAKFGVGVPMVVLSSFVFSSDEDLRQTARIFIIGWPFVHWGKNIIKEIKSKSCLRPWRENFNSTERVSGGFPSGHMANVMYAATLFGLRHGPKWGIPIGLFGIFVAVDFMNCNRHYLSQLIAGAGLGAIYAFAANKVVDKKLSEKFSCSFDTDFRGRPAISLAYSF